MAIHTDKLEAKVAHRESTEAVVVSYSMCIPHESAYVTA